MTKDTAKMFANILAFVFIVWIGPSVFRSNWNSVMPQVFCVPKLTTEMCFNMLTVLYVPVISLFLFYKVYSRWE
jgi:hypothetical protein